MSILTLRTHLFLAPGGHSKAHFLKLLDPDVGGLADLTRPASPSQVCLLEALVPGRRAPAAVPDTTFSAIRGRRAVLVLPQKPCPAQPPCTRPATSAILG